MTLGAEHTVDPTVLMLRDTYIIDVRRGNHVVGHGDGFLPETEVVDAVGRLRHGKITLSVGTLYTDDEQILTLPLDGTCIESTITHDALHQIRIVLLVEIVLPLQGNMFCRHHGILILLIDAVPPLYGFVLATQQCLVMGT